MDLKERTYQLDEMKLRLERSHRCVMRLRKKISSYKYEPNNYECFVKLRKLRSELNELSKQQSDIVDALHPESQTTTTSVESINTLLEQHKALEDQVASYISDTRGYV